MKKQLLILNIIFIGSTELIEHVDVKLDDL